MKILIIQSAGQHNGTTRLCKNDYMRECLGLQYAFEKNGWNVDVWGIRFSNFKDDIDFNSYDYILNMENYEMDWLPDFSKIIKPIKMQWVIDLHCQSPEVYAKTSKHMNIILHATKSLIPSYEEIFPDIPHIWFPPGIDDRYFKKYDNIIKQINIVFVGNVINRGEYIQKLHNDVGLEYHMRTGEEMLNLISSSKIHFNKTMSPHGTNYRNLETIALGTCLLADNKPEVCELGFKNGVNCLLYNNYEDCLKKYKYAMMKNINGKYNWEIIGDNGIELAKQHTYYERVKKLIGDLTNIK
jgi:hypothetical protein